MKRLIIITLLLISLSATASASITYDSGANTITVTGYTEGTPCTFTDIYNADQSGGWGVVSKQGTNQFLLQCLLYVGDGSTVTYLTTIEEQITFETSGCGSWKSILYVRNNGVFTSGVLIDESKRQGKHGSSIMVKITDTGDTSPNFWIESTGIAYLYATHIVCINEAGVNTWNVLKIYNFNANCRVYQTIFTDIRGFYDSVNVDCKNFFMIGCYAGITYGYLSADSEDIWLFGSALTDIYNPPKENTGQPPIKNFYAEKIATWSTPTDYIGGLRNYLGPLPFPIIDWRGTPVAGCQIKWYADMDLEITDVNGTDIVGATVTIKNKDGTVQFSTDTDASGKVSETVWVVKDEWSGSGDSNTRTDYNDFTIEIKKAGYQTYKDIFTFYKKVDWTIALQKYNNTCNNTCNVLSTEINLIDQKYHEFAHIGYQTMHIPIYTGLNYISIPLYQYNTTLATLFGDHPVTNDTMKKYVNGVWNVSTYNNGTWNNANNIEPIKPCVGYEYNRTGDNFTLNVSGFMKYDIDIFNYKNRVGTNIIRPMRSDKND